MKRTHLLTSLAGVLSCVFLAAACGDDDSGGGSLNPEGGTQGGASGDSSSAGAGPGSGGSVFGAGGSSPGGAPGNGGESAAEGGILDASTDAAASMDGGDAGPDTGGGDAAPAEVGPGPEEGGDAAGSGDAETDAAEAGPECGDGVVDEDETCDGNCPTAASCTDDNACTTHSYTGSVEDCTAVCTKTDITACTDDGCCPDACNANNDPDCDPTCPNGVKEAGEKCDGDCPTTCAPRACKTAELVGSAEACTAECVYEDVACATGDECCPSGCTFLQDNDCPQEPPECGNGVVEPGEDCEPVSSNDPDCSPACLTPKNDCLGQAEDRGQDPDDACVDCSCEECANALDRCFNATDTTAEGVSKGDLCAALVLCGWENSCFSALACLGPCGDEMIAAGETSDVFELLARQDDSDYALGRANEVSACAQAGCRTQCQ